MGIQPERYFLIAYAILRSIPNKLGGVVALALSIAILLICPFLPKRKFRGLIFYPLSKIFLNARKSGRSLDLDWCPPSRRSLYFYWSSLFGDLFYYYFIDVLFKKIWDALLKKKKGVFLKKKKKKKKKS